MDLWSTFAPLLGPVEVNQILRVPHNDISSYEVIQLGLLLFRHDQELPASPIDLDWFPGSQNMIKKAVRGAPRNLSKQDGSAKFTFCEHRRDLTGRLALRDTFALGEAFASATKHHRQWGYPETVVLGRDGNHDEIFTPEEVAAGIQGILHEC
jgi:hypothetical protein